MILSMIVATYFRDSSASRNHQYQRQRLARMNPIDLQQPISFPQF